MTPVASKAVSGKLQPECAADLAMMFREPPMTHAPVPFYWWAGEKLEKGRLAWQLDQLRERGIRQVVVSYPHGPEGGNSPGDPPLFSTEWWDLFRWFLAACRERGMTAGFQDYTLVEPILREIGQRTDGMDGGQMTCVAAGVSFREAVRLSAEPECRVVAAWAYPVRSGLPAVDGAMRLDDFLEDGTLEWTAPEGEWFAALVFVRGSGFDPMHPQAGELAVGALYQPFERECPGEVGDTLAVFFQDELDFGSRMPFWSRFLLDEFAARKGYDLRRWLPALWHDLGPMTEKVRLDYATFVVERIEDCYFKPVFRWHEERGTLFGHDNCGRGRIAEGRAHYGDYFQTMKWFTAPGCDDPKLHGPRAFMGLKVNSSIAHLYQRPRVWLEAFHSSGWGTTPREVVAALNEDFACGANVVNLHGLYYSTCGGWWEWAPPDFHFRQPYWMHAGRLNAYLTRLCWLLSRGVHGCDVAIVYPVAALHALPADPSPPTITAHVGNQRIGAAPTADTDPEECAFGIGRFLFDRACDFDFVDHATLSRAVASDGELRAGPGRYRVLILPAMGAVHFSTLEKARDLVRAGGMVVAYGRLPRASERAGRGDPAVDSLLEEIFGTTGESSDHCHRHEGGGLACFVRGSYDRVMALIDASVERDVNASVPLQVLHRRLDDRQIYFLFNPADVPLEVDASFRAAGRASWWNAWTGDVECAGTGRRHRFHIGAGEARVLVFDESDNDGAPAATMLPDPPRTGGKVVTLDGPWGFRVEPVLDNRFRDFSLVAGDGLLGPEARRFLYADEFPEGLSGWRETTFSFGSRLEVAGPLPPDADGAAIESELIAGTGVSDWREYAFSTRWGIERDPFLTDWLSGPHGLKGRVPDEYLDFHSDLPGSMWYLRASVDAPVAGKYPLITGGRCIYQVWINGTPAASRAEALPAGIYQPWNIPHYECEPLESRVTLRQGRNDLLIKLVQPAGQRTRAFVAFSRPPADQGVIGLRWFADDRTPRPCLPAPATRQAIRFRFPSPPGACAMSFVSRGPARAWLAGKELDLHLQNQGSGGVFRYTCRFTDPAEVSSEVVLRVEAPAESRGGDALPQPVAFQCSDGRIPIGDWCDHGLATYSGAATYTRDFEVAEFGNGIRLDLGALSATAEVHLNGMQVATLVAPPWTCDLTPFLRPGRNELAVTVANTLANHYSVGIPSPYAFPQQTPSGLFGPVTLTFI